MAALLNNEFAPVTFDLGFIEASFPSLCRTFEEWRRSLGIKAEFAPITAPLRSALLSLEPLTTPLDRYLLVETKSNWTAIFANGLRVSDVASPVGYLPTVLKCRGLEVGYAPDLSKSHRKDLIRSWGYTNFILNGPTNTDWLNRIRDLRVWNDVSGWAFTQSGEIQPFEETEHYTNQRIRERFTLDMLERYCSALGIALSEEEFYGPRCLAVRDIGRTHPGHLFMSIAEARSHLDL